MPHSPQTERLPCPKTLRQAANEAASWNRDFNVYTGIGYERNRAKAEAMAEFYAHLISLAEKAESIAK